MITRLGANSFWLFTSRLATQALAVLFTVLLARRLGSAGFGVFAFLSATLFTGNILTTFGTDMLLMREIAARRDLARLPAALLLQLGLSLVFVLLVNAGAAFFPNQSPESILALRIYILALIPLAFYTVFTTVLRGMERMLSYALLGLAVVLLQTAALGSLLSGGIAALAAWLLAAQILAALLAGFFCFRQIPGFRTAWRLRGGPAWGWASAVTDLARASSPIALLSFLSMAYQKLSIYILSALGGAALTGWFSTAQRAVEASKTAHASVFTALYPAMARAEPGSQKTFRLAQAALLAGALLLALGLSLLAPTLVSLLFGAAFAPAVPALRILAWMLVPYTLNTYLILAFLAAKQERRVTAALLASLLALALLSAWWIPRMGLAGAAYAALAAESVQAVMLLAQRGLQFKINAGEKAHEFSKLS